MVNQKNPTSPNYTPPKQTTKGVSSTTHTKTQLDDYSNQNNPGSDAHKAARDNRANTLNPNNPRHTPQKKSK